MSDWISFMMSLRMMESMERKFNVEANTKIKKTEMNDATRIKLAQAEQAKSQFMYNILDNMNTNRLNAQEIHDKLQVKTMNELMDKQNDWNKYSLEKQTATALTMQGNNLQHLDYGIGQQREANKDFFSYSLKSAEGKNEAVRALAKINADISHHGIFAQSNVAKYLSANKYELENRKLDFLKGVAGYLMSGYLPTASFYSHKESERLAEDVHKLGEQMWKPQGYHTHYFIF